MLNVPLNFNIIMLCNIRFVRLVVMIFGLDRIGTTELQTNFFYSISKRCGFLINLILWNGLSGYIRVWDWGWWFWSQAGNQFKIHIMLTKTNMHILCMRKLWKSWFIMNRECWYDIDDDDYGFNLALDFHLLDRNRSIVSLETSISTKKRAAGKPKWQENKNKFKIEFIANHILFPK